MKKLGKKGLWWAILPERVHHWRNILSCTAKTSKHLIKNNIGQFICILWPSFDHKNIFDKLNRFLRYRHIKMRQWWNAEFHRFCILIWWYLKNIFSLSRTFCWAKLGQSVWLNCPIFLLAKCLLVSAMQDKMWQKKWKLLRENCPILYSFGKDTTNFLFQVIKQEHKVSHSYRCSMSIAHCHSNVHM